MPALTISSAAKWCALAIFTLAAGGAALAGDRISSFLGAPLHMPGVLILGAFCLALFSMARAKPASRAILVGSLAFAAIAFVCVLGLSARLGATVGGPAPSSADQATQAPPSV